MEHRDRYPEMSVTRTAERRYPQRVPGCRPPRLHRPGQRGRARGAPGEGYQTTDTIGKTGVEQMFEIGAARQAGQGQGRGRQPGPGGRTWSTCKQPEAGHDVRLTLDLPTQHIAEESLAQGMDGARTPRRPGQRQLLRPATAARWSCSTRGPGRSWRWRRTRASTPTTSSPATPTSTSSDPTSR